MFNRSILENLRIWKKKRNRKPLILRGARQVGKTTAINIFAQDFENYMEINLEKIADHSLFNATFSIRDIFQAILLSKNLSLQPGSTLLFIDEIQNLSGRFNAFQFIGHL